MELSNDLRSYDLQLDRNIKAILDSPQSTTHGETDIQRLVSILWEKVANNDDNGPLQKTATGMRIDNAITTNDGNSTIFEPASVSTTDGNSECSNDAGANSLFQYEESVSLFTNTTSEFSNTTITTTTTTTAESTSPSILSSLNITPAREQPRIRENLFCCRNEDVAKKLTSLTHMEFMNQKQEYCKILKDISVKSIYDRMYFYSMDSSIHVKTNSILLQIQSIKKIQYVICEGYKNSLIFCDHMLSVENFMYFPLLSQAQLVSLHTVANLSMNHLSKNRLPLYMSLNQTNESKFVRTFLKLTDFELHYTSIKHRIPAIIKHNSSCNLFKK